MTTQTELTQLLDELEASLPKMIEDNPDPSDFWLAFAGEADVIEDQAGDHAALVHQRIETMLGAHGRAIAGIEIEETQLEPVRE
jgi:hypothetical protein